MIGVRGLLHFKNSLPDGCYRSYMGDTNNITHQAYFHNGLKDGPETSYWSFKKNWKYEEINWRHGEKNGSEIHFNVNGTVEWMVNWSHDKLDGHFIINWTDGQKNYEGYFKNNYQDSLWTYYKFKKSGDSLIYWISKQKMFKNGTSVFLNAWLESGEQTVINGNGTYFYEPDSSWTIEFKNGLMNGRSVRTILDTAMEVKFYKDDLLINYSFYSGGKIKFSHSYGYGDKPVLDTVFEMVDNSHGDIKCNIIRHKEIPLNNGIWEAYYDDGSIIYHGRYYYGKRIGVWYYYFQDSVLRAIANYDSEAYTIYDSTGTEMPSIYFKYLEMLTDNSLCGSELSDSSFFILKNFDTNQMCYSFYPDGRLQGWCWECEEMKGKYNIDGDKLTFSYWDQTGSWVFQNYLIISANDDEIILKRL